MTGPGEGLYAAWCSRLRANWREPTGLLASMARADQPREPPVAWAFLSAAEQHAWDGLAEQLQAVAGPEHPLALRPLG